MCCGSIIARIKSVAEDKGQAGLRMASLEFDIVPSKEDLIMRDATAAHICRNNGIDVPVLLANCNYANIYSYNYSSANQWIKPNPTSSQLR